MSNQRHVGHKVVWRLREDKTIHSLTYDNLLDALKMVSTLQSSEVKTDRVNEYGQPIYKQVYRGEADYFNITPIWQ